MSRRHSSKSDWWLLSSTRTCSLVSIAIVCLVVGFLLIESMPAISKIGIWRFFADDSWHPLSGQFNLFPMIVATLLTALGALMLAGPLGIVAAIFTHYYAPPTVSRWYARLIELLAGIPSVVFGLWGLVVLAPIVAQLGGSGQSLLTATLVLGLMILPTVALVTQASFQRVPGNLISGGAALGLGRWGIVSRIAIPAAKKGIVVGLLLAVSRAVGETMAVLMLAGNVVQVPDSIIAPVRTLTANIALEMGYATSEHRSILFVSGLVLMSVVVAFALLAELFEADRHE